MRCCVTGATGFVAHYLCSHLLDLGHEVHGFSVWRDMDTRFTRPLAGRMKHSLVDICDPVALDNFFDGQHFDAIFHLAGQSLISAAKTNPGWTFQVNAAGTANLLEAIVRNKIGPRFIQLSSSSDVYGDVPEDRQPIREWTTHDRGAFLTPVQADNSYGTSKAAMELIGKQYKEQHGLNIISTRLFTCCGPMQYDDSMLGYFSKKCALVALGKSNELPIIGCPTNKRNFIDVRDTVRAYVSLMDLGLETEIYHDAVNVAGAETWTIGGIATALEYHVFDATGKTVEIPIDETKARPNDKHVQVGSGSLLKELTGFIPEIPFDRTIRESFDYWCSVYGGSQ